MMNIFTTKENALIHLNSVKIEAGEIRVYRYYSDIGNIDSFVVIGIQDGIGPDCYQVLSKRKNLIVNIDSELPDVSRLIQGQIHVCPVSGVYHMIYVEGSQRINREISDSEVYYVEDFDSGFMYYLDRYTCKRLDDYFSKVYIDLSNTSALYETGKYPETTITVWKDNSDITATCQIGITTSGCSAIYDGSKTIRVTSMTEKTAKVIIRVVYRGSTYQETWNIQKVQEGIKGSNAEVWSVLSKKSFIREPDMQTTTFQVLYQSGTELSYLEVPRLQDYGLRLTYEYSNGTTGQINTQDFEFESRILDDDTELTFCIIRLLNQESQVLSAITLPYLPDTDTLSSGQGVYKAIVFCRSNEMPETPQGGSWDSPIPVIGQWSQEVQEGSEALWTSTRIFTTDAKPPQDPTWSVPSRISNTENLEVMYSTCQDITIVGTPSTKPENWEPVVSGIAYFMATRTITNGVPGLWQVFAIHGIDGDKSNYKNYIYFNSTTKPATPVGSHPDGWVDFPDTDGIWWMCVGLFSGSTDELIGTWSNPIKVSGIDGNAGQDAPYLIYQYSVGTSPVDAPTYNWSSSIPSVPKGMYLWQRSGTIIPPAIAPTSWNVPVRITGERGEDGAPGTAVTIDLTNEVSSVAADYEGNVIAAATFETTQVLLYCNGNPVDLEHDENVRNITITPDGVQASISKAGIVTIHSWIAPIEQDTATVVISINYNYNTYTAVYSIQKVKSGAPGESAVLYSIIPSTNVLRKVNSVISPSKLTAQVRKAVGSRLSNITDLRSEGIELVYSVNGSVTEEVYNFSNGILTAGIDFVTFTLKSLSTGSVIDKETVITFESTLDLIVDLTNELSAVSASETGELTADSHFETSAVKIYYGSEEIQPFSCQITPSWTNMTGTFNQATGVITPTGWDSNKLNETSGQCTLEVSYREFTKTVTYTVTKVNSGKTPILWRITPSVTGIKATSSSVSSNLVTVSVYKIYGTDQTEVSPANFRQEGIKLQYARTFEGDNEPEAEKTYTSSGIPITLGTDKVEIVLYDLLDNVLDRESVYVVRDGAPGAKSDWKDYIFCKKETQPDRPTFTNHPVSGSIDNHGQVWYDGPAPGSTGDTWWMSMATIDGESNENALLESTSWSIPIRVTGYDGTGYECQYTNSKNLVTPPEGAVWTTTPIIPPSGYYTWMRMRSTRDSEWKYMRVTGERGSDGDGINVKGDFVYVGDDNSRIQSNTGQEILLIGDTAYTDSLNSYTGNIYVGQQMTPVSEVSNGDTYLYDGRFFICTGTSGTMNTWSAMTVQGDPGDSWMTYVAFASNSNGSDKTQVWSSGKTYIGVAVVNTADYPSWSSVSADLYTWAEFHGKEGIGNEFIFARNNSDSVAPSLNENETVNGLTKMDDEYIPNGWTDDPQAVEDVNGHRVQWVSTRQKVNGSWSPFSSPVIWNRWAKDGTSISVKGTLDSVSKTPGTSNYILIPSTADDYTTGMTSVIGDLYLGQTKQTNVSNGDTYTYQGFFIICSGSTGNYYSWSITAAKGDPGESAYVHVLYADDASGTNETTTWSPGKEYFAVVSTNTAGYPNVSVPRVWAKFRGQDGIGHEFIFIRTGTENAVFSPSPETLSANQNDEYLPTDSVFGRWSDDPVDVDAEHRIQWISQRTKNGDSWSKFSKPTVWSRYAKDGTGISVKGVLQNVGPETNFQNYILTNSYVHGTSTTCNGKLFIEGTEVTNVVNGDTYSYDGYFFICSGSTSGIYDWSIAKAKGDDGSSSYVFVRYSATSGSGGTMSDTWSSGMKYIGFATSDRNIVPAKGDFVWSEFLGHDGVGQEFIYCLSDTLTQAMRNIAGISISASSSESSNNKSFQDDEFLPSSSYAGDNQWTDDPQDVREETGKRRQWISSRVRRGGSWGQFSVPSLWSEVSGSTYDLILGNQNLNAVFSGIGVVRPSVSYSSIESAIVNGDCAGTTVSYFKGNQSTQSTFTIEANQGVLIYVYSSNSWQSFTGNGSISVSTSNFEIFLSCSTKSMNQWSATITSADGVSKTLTVTRTAFAPSISLDISSYCYNKDDNNNVTYTPSKTTSINIKYISNGHLTTLSAFTSYGYYVRSRYVSEIGAAGSWISISSDSFTLQTIVGSSNPSGGSLEFEVTDSSEVFYRATISIIASANLDSVKIYLLDGNAAITGHLWAKDGKIGNWIINALDNSAGNISYNGTVIASYDSSYPVGSLRSSNGTIVFDPNESSNGGIWLKYTNNNQDFIKCNGSGRLAQGNFTWDDSGNVSLTGSITSSYGSIAGWKINSTSIYNRDFLNDGTEHGSGIEINSTDKSVITYNVIIDQSVGSTPYFTYQGLSISPSGGLQIYESDNRNHWTPISYIRPDGSGLLANGNIRWDSSGSGILAGWSFNDTKLSKETEFEVDNVTTTEKITLTSSDDVTGTGIFITSHSAGNNGGALVDKHTTLSLDPRRGFRITSSDLTNLSNVVASIDLNGSGSLASGNISWDSTGTIKGPVTMVTNSASDHAWIFETNGNIKTYKKFTAINYSLDASNYNKTEITPGSIVAELNAYGDIAKTTIDSGGIKVYKLASQTEYSEAKCDSISVTDGTDTSEIKPDKIDTPKLVLTSPSDGCCIYSANPPAGNNNVTLTVIDSKNDIYLGSATYVGDYESGTPYTIFAGAFTQSSDERLKTKISDITLTSEQISGAPSIVYHWNTDGSKTRRAGTIAQYWKNILPEVVSEDHNGNLGLNYSELSTISVISLAKEIVELKKRIKELENK